MLLVRGLAVLLLLGVAVLALDTMIPQGSSANVLARAPFVTTASQLESLAGNEL
jgi:hypothetical protein